MKSHTINIDIKLKKLPILFVIGAGLVIALIKFTGILLPLGPMTLFVVAFFPFVLYNFLIKAQGKGINRVLWLLILFVVLLIFIKPFLFFPNDLNFDAIFWAILLSESFMLFFLYRGTSVRNSIQLLIFTSRCILFSLIIGYAQMLFRTYLPLAFIELPTLGENMDRVYLQEFNFLDVFRPNGLVGNPIVYGFILNIGIAIDIFLLELGENKKFRLLKIIFSALLIFLMFSRMNTVFMLFLVSSWVLFRASWWKIILGSSVIIPIVVSAFIYLVNNNEFVAYSFRRFTGEDGYTQASNDEHINDFIAAIETIKNYPLRGYPINKFYEGEQIITDGAWLTFILHLGGVAFIFFFIYWLILIGLSLIQVIQGKKMFIFFPLMIGISLSCVVNSAMMGRNTLIFTFALLGIIFNLMIQTKHE